MTIQLVLDSHFVIESKGNYYVITSLRERSTQSDVDPWDDPAVLCEDVPKVFVPVVVPEDDVKHDSDDDADDDSYDDGE